MYTIVLSAFGAGDGRLGSAMPSSELDHDLDRLAIVHCPVAIRHTVDVDDPIEHAARLDDAFQRLEDDRSVDREVRLARVAALRAAIAAAVSCPGAETASFVRHRYEASVIRAATEAQRQRLVALRSDETIGDAAFHRVEGELDWDELDWAQLVRAGQPAIAQS